MTSEQREIDRLKAELRRIKLDTFKIPEARYLNTDERNELSGLYTEARDKMFNCNSLEYATGWLETNMFDKVMRINFGNDYFDKYKEYRSLLNK